MRNITLEEKPAVIAPATPVESSGPATATAPDEAANDAETTAPAQDSAVNSWASNWNEDEQKAAQESEPPAEEAVPAETVNEVKEEAAPADPAVDEIAVGEEDGDDDEIPTWLKAFSASGPVEAAPRPSVSGYTEMAQGSSANAFDTPVQDEDLPDWLREDAAGPACEQ